VWKKEENRTNKTNKVGKDLGTEAADFEVAIICAGDGA
jgi:hypothetical protein